MNLGIVLRESLQHYGIERNVPFTNRSGSSMSVNFEVTDTKRAILSVHEGCGNGLDDCCLHGLCVALVCVFSVCQTWMYTLI